MPTSERALALRARWALPWIFFLVGLTSMAWVPRIPEIKSSLGLSDGEFGVVLVSSSVGAIIGAQLAGRLIQRFGSRNLMRFAQTTLPLGVLLMGLAPNVYVLALGLFFMGLGSAAMDIPGNAQAVVIERLIGKKFLASLHGAWSIGTFAAALIGGAVATFVSPAINLGVLAAIGMIIFIPLTERMLDATRDEHMGDEGKDERRIPWFKSKVNLLWVFAFGSLGALVAEGASADWSGILLAEHMNIELGLTASAFASFSLSMIISRFTADALMERFGAARVVFYGGVVGGAIWSASILIAVPLSQTASQTNNLLALVLINIGFLCSRCWNRANVSSLHCWGSKGSWHSSLAWNCQDQCYLYCRLLPRPNSHRIDIRANRPANGVYVSGDCTDRYRYCWVEVLGTNKGV